jgi:hypothetical protein
VPKIKASRLGFEGAYLRYGEAIVEAINGQVTTVSGFSGRLNLT